MDTAVRQAEEAIKDHCKEVIIVKYLLFLVTIITPIGCQDSLEMGWKAGGFYEATGSWEEFPE